MLLHMRRNGRSWDWKLLVYSIRGGRLPQLLAKESLWGEEERKFSQLFLGLPPSPLVNSPELIYIKEEEHYGV